MKKKLEADLISIAHRILQLKNKSDVNQLFLETQKLYEKLAVLRFVEEHFGDPKPTIGQAEVVEKMKEFFESIKVPELQVKAINSEAVSLNTPEVESIVPEDVEKTNTEEILETVINDSSESNETELSPIAELPEIEDVIEEPKEEIAIIPDEITISPIVEEIETIKTDTPKKTEAVQISFEDLLGGNYAEPHFVKATPLEKNIEKNTIESPLPFDFQKEAVSNAQLETLEKEEPKTITLNDKLTKGITIGLNDRIAFVKHLFGGNNEDYNRVLNQLITYDTFQDTKNFIDELVKPDYNNWEGKEDYEHRFMEIIEKKFLSF
ncbi:hypothetical protein [Flavobacterium sp. N3904]|uniref:hypothetical protein n=1 Tax=Flavobacterium sp. N3904 TaxID=2986835 RepID=UPI002225623E|nr:hypothetical protein [Flavobacterium sp. N3904]